MAALRTVNLFLAFIATIAPLAHVLELPSKLMLDGPLWLAIQQHLYRGWGTPIGMHIGSGGRSATRLRPPCP